MTPATERATFPGEGPMFGRVSPLFPVFRRLANFPAPFLAAFAIWGLKSAWKTLLGAQVSFATPPPGEGTFGEFSAPFGRVSPFGARTWPGTPYVGPK